MYFTYAKFVMKKINFDTFPFEWELFQIFMVAQKNLKAENVSELFGIDVSKSSIH